MRFHITRALVIAGFGLWLAGCSTSNKLSDMFGGKNASPPETTGSIGAAPDAPASPEADLFGANPNDDLNLGKQQYRANNFGLAERYFRRAVESHPRDAEAWLGLAASYDRLHRFDLADRAYAQVIAILGATPEVMNNQGFSYMLRGDYKRARTTLLAAQRKDPRNKYVANNLRLLDSAQRKGKAIR
jgi:Flp pilus assembly protein TadD